MKKAMLVTDLTRMSPPWVCVGGYWRDLTPVRPKFLYKPGLREDFLFQGSRPIIRPFAVVELEFLHSDPKPPHTEDWIINPSFIELKEARLPEERARAFLEKILDPDVASIFGTEIHSEPGYYVRAGEGTRSLGTIRPKRIVSVQYTPKEGNKWDYRICFEDQPGKHYRLAVTDLGFRYYCDYKRIQGDKPQAIAADLERRLRNATVFLRIGLARGWEKYPDRCYLQITAVHTFPDYLEGRCFADFDLSQETGSPVPEEEEIPY
jgi:hypothetical protein